MNKKKLFFSFLLISTFVHFTSFFFGFVAGDDFHRIQGNNNYINQGIFEYIFETMPERPFLLFTIYLDHLIFGYREGLYRITSVVYIAFAGLFIYEWLSKLNKFLLNKNYDPFWIVVFFLVLPINAQVVTVVIQRGVILSLLFGVLFFLSNLKSIEESNRKEYLKSILYFYLAVLSKPNSFIFIIFLLFYIFYRRYKIRKIDVFTSLVPHLLIYIYPITMFLLFKRDINVVRSFSSIEYFSYQISNFFIYIRTAIIPYDLRFLHTYKIENIFMAPKTIISTFMHLLIFYKCFNDIKKKKKKGYIILIFLYLSMIPESSFFPITHVYFDHRFYLASIFLIWFIFVILIKNINEKLLILIAISYGVYNNYHSYKISNGARFAFNDFKYNYFVPDISSSLLHVLNASEKNEENEKMKKYFKENINFEKEFKDLEVILQKSINLDELSKEKKNKFFSDIIIYINRHQIDEKINYPDIHKYLIEYLLMVKMREFIDDDIRYIGLIEIAVRRIFFLFFDNPKAYMSLIIRYNYLLKTLLNKVKKENIELEPIFLGNIIGQYSCLGNETGELKLKINEKALDIYKKYSNRCNKKI